MTGKLHSVSDSSVIIFVQGTVSSLALKNEVRNHEIQGAMIKGKSNVLKGMGLGLLAGTVTGAAIGGIAALQADNSVEDIFAPVTRIVAVGSFAAYGGMAGLAVGGIAGAASSTSSQEIELVPNQSFLFLKTLARHTERKPEDKW
jgi:hypothetical protein